MALVTLPLIVPDWAKMDVVVMKERRIRVNRVIGRNGISANKQDFMDLVYEYPNLRSDLRELERR